MKSGRMPKSNKPKRNGQSFTAPWFAHVQKEVKLAHERVGVTAIARLKWLLDFAYEDLANLSRGQLSDRGWEIVAFITPADFQADNDGRAIMDLSIFTSQDDRTGRVEEQLIRKFHDLLRQGMDDIFKGSGWEFDEPEKRRKIGFVTSPPYGSFTQTTVPRQEVRLIVAAYNLIAAEISRLGKCQNQNCKRPFVAARKGRAFFCSPRCSAYVRVNRARGKLEKLKGS